MYGSRLSLLALALLTFTPSLPAQEPELFDDTVLRTIDITVLNTAGNPDPLYWARLVTNWNQGQNVNLTANLVIDGPDLPAPVVRSGVGIRIKGNSSFFFLPSGSRKASFNIEIDHVDPAADLFGYQTINLNNGIEDPTFCREVAFFRFIRRYTPAGLGNHVVLTINGDEFGVYASLQQYNKTLLDEHYEDGGGVRIKCPNIGGAALRWFGANIQSYFNAYELKYNGGLSTNAAWQTLVDACNVLNNTPLTTPEIIEDGFDIDGAIWSVIAENLFMDEDSYISKGADFNFYWNPTHDRGHLHQHDGNESWGVSLFGWPGGTITELSPTYQFSNSQRPVVQRIASVPAWRERYFAHFRTMLEDFTWADLHFQLMDYRALIDAAVQADPEKLYTYQQFLDNFFIDTQINIGGNIRTAPGLRRFLAERRAYLLNHTEMAEPPPAIDWVRHVPYRPLPGQTVTVTAKVSGPVAPVEEVLLYYRDIGRFLSLEMLDDGLHGDGVAGDGIYGATLPLALSAGSIVNYYVGAQSDAASGGAMRFHPKYAEGKPLDIRVGFGATGLRITEYMYSGGSGEFVELTNTSAAPINLSGWSLDDNSGDPGTFDLSPAGIVAPGASIIVTQGDAAAFSAAWNLTGVTVLGLNTLANLGRNDAIHVFDSANDLVDRLAYGDERYEYSVRAKDESAYVCGGKLGQDDPYGYRESAVGDVQGSVMSLDGDTGSPGSFVLATCDDLTFGDVYCISTANSTGASAELFGTGSPLVAANEFGLLATSLPQNQFGYFLMGQVQGSTAQPGNSQGVLCLGNPIARLTGTLANSGASGELSTDIDLYNVPLPGAEVVAAGETWSFQAWYRDINPGITSNFTSGIEVVFQ